MSEREAKIVYLTGRNMPTLNCGCAYCFNEYIRVTDKPWWAVHSVMHLCEDCGNKRCPKATFHGYACTGSNAPGQAGSRYGGQP